MSHKYRTTVFQATTISLSPRADKSIRIRDARVFTERKKTDRRIIKLGIKRAAEREFPRLGPRVVANGGRMRDGGA